MPLKDAQRVQRKEARRIYTKGLRSGTVVRADSCQRCSSGGPIHGHHDDYDKPLEILSLCSSCHALRHALISERKAFDGKWAKGLYLACHRGAPEAKADAYVARREAELANAWDGFFAMQETTQ